MLKRRGRPLQLWELKKVPVGFRLPRWLVLWLRSQPASSAVLIESALISQHSLIPPYHQYLLDDVGMDAVLELIPSPGKDAKLCSTSERG